MNDATVFGLCASALIGLGLYGLIVNPQPLRKILAFNVIGMLTAGAFLAYPPGIAKPLILVIEFALMPTLTLILGLMLLGAPQRGAAR